MEENTLRRWFIPGILLFILIVCLLGWNQIELYDLHSFWWDFLKRGLEAGVIAMILALTVDLFLKKEFGREVFFASMGYVLPRELQKEMRWLCQLNQICTEDMMICTLTPAGNSIKFHVHRTQTVKNIGRGRHNLEPPAGLGIDEWFREEGKSRIIKFSILSATQQWSHNGSTTKLDDGFGLRVPNVPRFELQKDETLTIISEFEEFYPRNGYFYMHLKYPTSGAKVTVKCPDDSLGIHVQFATREEAQAIHTANDYLCPFTLLPYQRIAVRFWDKKESKQWIANDYAT